MTAKYIPSPRDWVREQVELYESSGGTRGTTLRDTGLPVILVTHTGNKTGAIRKTPLMRVKDGDSYVLVGSQGGAPKDPVWVHNLRANPQIELLHRRRRRRREYPPSEHREFRPMRPGAECSSRRRGRRHLSDGYGPEACHAVLLLAHSFAALVPPCPA